MILSVGFLAKLVDFLVEVVNPKVDFRLRYFLLRCFILLILLRKADFEWNLFLIGNGECTILDEEIDVRQKLVRRLD